MKKIFIMNLFILFTLVSCNNKEIDNRSDNEKKLPLNDYFTNNIKFKDETNEDDFNSFIDSSSNSNTLFSVEMHQGVKLEIYSKTTNDDNEEVIFDYSESNYYDYAFKIDDDSKLYSYIDNVSRIVDKSSNSSGDTSSGTFSEFLDSNDGYIQKSYTDNKLVTTKIKDDDITSYKSEFQNYINTLYEKNAYNDEFINSFNSTTYYKIDENNYGLKGKVSFTYEQIIFDCDAYIVFNKLGYIKDLIYEGVYDSTESSSTYDMHAKFKLVQNLNFNEEIKYNIVGYSCHIRV